MRAFVGEVDHTGLRRFVAEDSIPRDEFRRLARRRSPCSDTIVWALLDDRDAEALRSELVAGRHGRACGLLLNWAVELISIRAAALGPARELC